MKIDIDIWLSLVLIVPVYNIIICYLLIFEMEIFLCLVHVCTWSNVTTKLCATFTSDLKK